MDLYDKNILLIEDDKHIYALIEAMLKPYEANLDLECNGKSGLKKATDRDYDLILLDIMLPEKDGWQVCRELKNAGVETPIIMVTAKVEETDKVLGLEMGADDYITKPFSPRELIARIKAVLRRVEKSEAGEEEHNETENILEFPALKLTIELENYRVKYGSKYLSLTPKEFELLAFLAQNREQVFKREQLLDHIWGFDNYAKTRTIDEHIKRIRKKLTKVGLDKEVIQTVWGVGYKFTMAGADNNDS
ncbi:MAG: response regulator transcription factor [Halanaerobiaceae bacterium]